eukprot:scaffold3339_cov174-Amphora_coffeaeformis.AAC.2
METLPPATRPGRHSVVPQILFSRSAIRTMSIYGFVREADMPDHQRTKKRPFCPHGGMTAFMDCGEEKRS